MDGLTPDRIRLRDRARDLAREAAAQAAACDRTGRYPWPTVRRMTEAGCMGMTVPHAHAPGRAASSRKPLARAVGRRC